MAEKVSKEGLFGFGFAKYLYTFKASSIFCFGGGSIYVHDCSTYFLNYDKN